MQGPNNPENLGGANSISYMHALMYADFLINLFVDRQDDIIRIIDGSNDPSDIMRSLSELHSSEINNEQIREDIGADLSDEWLTEEPEHSWVYAYNELGESQDFIIERFSLRVRLGLIAAGTLVSAQIVMDLLHSR